MRGLAGNLCADLQPWHVLVSARSPLLASQHRTRLKINNLPPKDAFNNNDGFVFSPGNSPAFVDVESWLPALARTE